MSNDKGILVVMYDSWNKYVVIRDETVPQCEHKKYTYFKMGTVLQAVDLVILQHSKNIKVVVV